ncbi:hypothetical protein [Lactobacillus helveticus]|jgi:outer membrane protein assembly factor BamA|uniref:Uncharacterized protein n=3 Tax=Lactobacillus helveticus TaxID=1587 RepID=U4QC21_LACHE|nr:hypothetical protein [Lactobacillus helveticus]ADX70133.1 Putative uncharacterized protein [Lactobacillus helveticus H10]ALI52513.1 hypothetical protein ALV80_05070 [Lactobacillus helveticus]NRN71995.1 hypothetical protein [Lactobacillus helveticus]NRN75289.1 hypothetical protein [Lactobacillus helveticus]NRN78370.1 hypothetical protein [Lactobacillus helveticus]
MLVRKIVKSTLFCSLGIIVGKTISEQKHKNTIKKILSADYMDDHTKVKLMQDLNNIKVNEKKRSKQVNTHQLKRNLKMITTQSASLVKKISKNVH